MAIINIPTTGLWAALAAIIDGNFGILENREVIVLAVSDFPTASGGIITLDATKVYKLAADLTLTDSIDLNSSTIFAHKRGGASLDYTASSGSLFVGASGGVLNNIELIANAGTASIFNLDNTGQDKVLNVISCRAGPSNDIGLIKNYSGVRWEKVFAPFNTTGITFDSIVGLLELERPLCPDSTTGTQIEITGAFNRVIMSGGVMDVTSGNTAIDITGITSITSGSISGATFDGVGTRFDGVDGNGHAPKEWTVVSTGLTPTSDSVSGGEIYFSGLNATETTIATVDTPVKIAGTTTEKTDAKLRFDATAGRLTYAGTVDVVMPVTVNASVIGASNNKTFSLYVAKNGTVDVSSRANGKVGTSSDEIPITSTANISFTPGDFVECFIENTSDSTNFTVTTFNMNVR